MNADPYQLSAREKEVVKLLLQGKSNKEIGLALGVSVSTVEFHLKNVYRKLGVKSRTEAILQLGKSTGGDGIGGPGQSVGGADGKLRESIVDGAGENTENGGNSISTQVIPMKQTFYVVGGTIVVFLLLTGAVLARFMFFRGQPPAVTPSEVSVPASPLMVEMGTSFIFPPGLGDGTEDEIVPQSTGGMVWPQHIKLTLVDYPLEDSLYRPQILVFPADEYRHMDQCSGAAIQGLEEVLRTGDVSVTVQSPCNFNTDTLPFLPDQKAAQVFHAREKILPFQNGTGLRYITQYSQAHFPAVNNRELFYTFHGLTDDGKYYVSVMLPVHFPALDGLPSSPANAEESASSFKVARDLLNQQDAALQPSLESLDALVQSITAGIQQ
jgi:DNA-binding CsgD family transcriptional regulator